MADAVMKFVKRPPDRLVLNGEEWFFHYGYDGKNGKRGNCSFSCSTPGRERQIVFYRGPARGLDGAMLQGFRVAGGSPERGLASALARIGLVTLEPYSDRFTEARAMSLEDPAKSTVIGTAYLEPDDIQMVFLGDPPKCVVLNNEEWLFREEVDKARILYVNEKTEAEIVLFEGGGNAQQMGLSYSFGFYIEGRTPGRALASLLREKKRALIFGTDAMIDWPEVYYNDA